MGKYSADAKELLRLVGGRENIAAVSHCITRMRFALVEPSKANIKAIEAMKVVKGSFTQSGQFQVIIGNTVPEFYNDFIKEAGLEGGSKEDVKQAAKKNQNVLQRIVTALAEIFAPLIPAIVTGGLILGFRNILEGIAFFEDGTKTLVQISVFWNGVNHFLWLLGEAIFHMLPVGVCWSVTRKMKTDQMLGIVLGLTLVSGQLLNAYGVAGAAAIPKWDFGFFQINMIGYQAQIIPAIMAAFTLVYLERFFRKITPEVISMIVVPFASLILAVVIAHFVLGPIGWKLGEAVSGVIYAGITGSFKIIFGAIFGFFYAPLVITGLHHMSNAIDLQLIASYGGTMLWPMIALSNIAQGSAVLGMIYMQRKNSIAQEVNVPATISCYLGVTEPAMFGVNLKYKFPFLAGMIGSGLAAILCVASGTTSRSIGIGGIPGILSIKTENMLSFALCMLIAIAVPFVLTLIYGKRKLSALDIYGELGDLAESHLSSGGKNKDSESPISFADKKENYEMKAFLEGKVITLKEVGDGVFSEGMMGEGLAIIPEDNIIYSPVDAEVTVLMPQSRHACGMLLANGMEILLHIGLDTVNMKGDGFEYLVSQNQKVKSGDALIRFDRDKIKKAGFKDTTLLIVTNAGSAKNIMFRKEGHANAKQTVIATYQ